MVRFIVYHNEEPIKTYELDEPLVTIGRLPENSISIANMGISRRHVRIEQNTEQRYVLTDLNSLNGTFVNGKKVKKHELSSGDKIAIGKYTILFESMAEEANVPQYETAPAAAGYQYEAAQNAQTPPPQPQAGAPAVHAPAPPAEPNPVREQASERKAAPASSAILIETNKHVVYKIDKPLMTIGSSEDDDVFVSGFMIGDGHVMIEKKEDGIWLESKKMMGKMKVNGRKTNTHLLEHKDRIEIGTSTFRYMEDS